MEVFRKSFDYYRGNFRLFEKTIHYLHLHILSKICTTISSEFFDSHNQSDKTDNDNIIPIMKTALLDFKTCFNKSPNYKKRYDNLRNRKLEEAELHNIITNIALAFTKEPRLASGLIDSDSYLLSDLIQYIITINNSQEDSIGLFIQVLTSGKIKNEPDNKNCINIQIAALISVSKVIENTLHLFVNMYSLDKNLSEKLNKAVK